MAAGAFFALFLFFALPLFVFHIWALIDVLRTPTGVWEETGQNQLLWGVVVLFLSLLGPILYVILARPALVEARGTGGA